MKRNTYSKCSLALLVSCLLSIFLCPIVNAEILFESATLANEGTDTMVGTYALDYAQHLGSRFHLDQSVEVTSIGGHFIGVAGTFFGALVAIDGPDDFPGIGSIFESEAIAYNTFSYNQINPSTDLRVSLSVVLDPGDYAVVFGSGLFGTDGQGGVIFAEQEDYPQADFITWEDSGGVWFNTSSTGTRFVIEGEVIPEPCTLLLLGMGGLLIRKK